MSEDTQAPPAEKAAKKPVSRAVEDARRERLHLAQTVADQVARSRSGGTAPDAAESARLVAEFHARGGTVTVLAIVPESGSESVNVAKPLRERDAEEGIQEGASDT